MLDVNFIDIKSFAKKRRLGLICEKELDVVFKNVMPISQAGPNDVAFCRFEDENGVRLIENTRSRFVFIPSLLAAHFMGATKKCVRGKIFAICDTPRLEMAYFLHDFWTDVPQTAGHVIHGSGGLVHPGARIAKSVNILPGAIVGANVSIGENTTIHSGAVVDNAIIGENCSIGSNGVIGGVGFGFETDPETNEIIDFPHVGMVRIGQNVRVGSCVCIDRASIGETVLEDNVKIDNLVHVGHNAKIGKGTRIVALSIIGGSAQIGENCWLAPASSIRDWIRLGDGSVIGMGAVVTKSVADGATVIGNPAREIKIERKKYL